MDPVYSDHRREGRLQFPVVTEGFIPFKGKYHTPTGIRCPRCQKREIVYNGNYFCAGYDEDECKWALPHDDPHPKNPQYDQPIEYWDLVDALIMSVKRRRKRKIIKERPNE